MTFLVSGMFRVLADQLQNSGDTLLQKEGSVIHSVLDKDLLNSNSLKGEETQMYKFKGWDWTELAYRWNLVDEDNSEGLDDEEFENRIRDYIEKEMNWPSPKERKDACMKDIKDFLVELSKYEDEYSKVWKAMLDIESNFVFEQFFLSLYKMMWV